MGQSYAPDNGIDSFSNSFGQNWSLYSTVMDYAAAMYIYTWRRDKKEKEKEKK